MPKLAVLGQPVSHSRSPAMQNAALAELGLAPEWSYEAIEVAPAEFEGLVAELARGGDFAGVNVTLPHKLAALALADDASPAARAIGAANTLSFQSGGIAAENTDAWGFLEALPAPPAGKRALVLGPGGDLGPEERGRRSLRVEPNGGESRGAGGGVRGGARSRRHAACRQFDALRPAGERDHGGPGERQ
jgi:hypothetical protein